MSSSEASIRLSVIIPTYNGLARLKTTIESVLAQTAPAHEIIVVDDGSTDKTPDIAGMFGDRIHYIRVENGGQQRARNIGVDAATSDWIALLDHDDRMEPAYLAEVQALVAAHSVDATIANSRTWEETVEGGYWSDSHRFTQFAPRGYWDRVGAKPEDDWSILDRYDYASYLAFHPAQTSMFAVRRELYLALGGFDTHMRGSGAENFEFEMRLLRVARVGLIWKPLITMVRHDSNASLDGNRMAMDVVDCLEYALANHSLTGPERAIVNAEVQTRLPDAITGSFALGRFEKLSAYRALARDRLPWKARLKSMIGRLPKPIAQGLAARLAS